MTEFWLVVIDEGTGIREFLMIEGRRFGWTYDDRKAIHFPSEQSAWLAIEEAGYGGHLYIRPEKATRL